MVERIQGEKWGRWLLLLGIALYVGVFTALAFDFHAGMRTHQSDLGQIDQAVWNSSQGRFLEFSKDDFLSTRLTDHVEPIFVLISPIFWLWNDVRALLLLQVLAVALGVLPLYAWTREKLGTGAGLALSAAYLLNPQLQSAILTEFHAIPLAVPLILWAFWASDKKHWGHFIVATLLLTAVKEEAALLAAGIAAWAVLQANLPKRTQRPGRQAFKTMLASRDFLVPMGVLLVALAWFVIAIFVIVPAHAGTVYGAEQSVYFHRYGPLGDTPLDIFTSFFTRPGQVWAIASEPTRLRYLFGLFFAFGFLPLLGIDVILFSLPLLLANLLSTYPAQYYGEFHYSAPLIPFFAVAALVGLQRLRQWRPQSVTFATLLLLAATLIFYGEAGRGPLAKRYDPTPITPHHRLLTRFVAQLPPDAAVTATAAIQPHVSHRRYAYKFPHGLRAAHPADWALIDVSGDTDMAPGDVKSTVTAMLAGEWGVVDAADGYLLLQRGAANKTIPPAFYDFARTPGQSPAPHPLTFVDISWRDWPRWRQTQVITRWQVGADYVPGSIRPWLEIRNLAGDRVYTDADLTPPALLWYPPQQWQPGDRIILTTLPLFLPRTWGAVVAAVHGPDPFTPQHRLPADAFLAEYSGLTTLDRTLALVDIVQRDQDDRLQTLPLPSLPQSWTDTKNARLATVYFRTRAGAVLRGRVRLPTRVHAGADIVIFSQWDQPLPDGVVLFMHLRQNGALITQSDGPLQIFIPLADKNAPWDWRQLSIPADIDADSPLELVLGLYHFDSGERLEALNANVQSIGNETSLGTITLLPPPVPDQTCALIPATCASQRLRD